MSISNDVKNLGLSQKPVAENNVPAHSIGGTIAAVAGVAFAALAAVAAISLVLGLTGSAGLGVVVLACTLPIALGIIIAVAVGLCVGRGGGGFSLPVRRGYTYVPTYSRTYTTYPPTYTTYSPRGDLGGRQVPGAERGRSRFGMGGRTGGGIPAPAGAAGLRSGASGMRQVPGNRRG